MRPVLIVPGYGNSGPGHWQSLLEGSLGAKRAEMPNWYFPRKVAWVDALDEAIGSFHEPPILVAHSLGCIAVAHWARTGSHEVVGALLVAPIDVERGDVLDAVKGFAPIPKSRLPFSSMVVLADNDPYTSETRGRDLARGWGARFHLLHGAGHINLESGYGPWPAGEALLQELR